MSDAGDRPLCHMCGASGRRVWVGAVGGAICRACVEDLHAGRALRGGPALDGVRRDVLATLTTVEAIAHDQRAHLGAVVGALRGRGVAWRQIGAALGVSRQAAWQRFSS